MHDLVCVDVLEYNNERTNDELGLILLKFSLLVQKIRQVSSSAELLDEIQMIFILKSKVNVGHEAMEGQNT